MAISASDIKYRFSTTAGSAGNSQAGTAAGSIGKYISTTDITDNTLNNLFDDVSGAENAASDVEYRCIFVLNDHATDSWTDVKVWLSAETGGGASIAIAVDGVAASAKGSVSAQADQVADENTAPTGETFSSPTTFGTGLSIGNLTAGQCRAIWVRRTAANTAALANDSVTIQAQGDSV